MPKKIVMISDAPTAPTGLGRIFRELALRIHENMPDTFEIATFGFGGSYSNKLPFEQYPMTHTKDYVAPELVKVWNDFVGEDRGIIFSCWNPSWTWWMSNPEKLGDGPLKSFLLDKPFDLWGYFPVDGDAVDGSLPESIGDVMKGYDRVLAYTQWGAKAIEKTLPKLGRVEYLPHGTDTTVFYRRDRDECRKTFIEKIVGGQRTPLNKDIFLVGVVATNSPRKDWYLAFEACAELMKLGVNVGMWAHTDAWRKHWDLESLAKGFGLKGRVMFTNREMSDDEMALAYTACDVTFGIGSGEGWGLPLAESLACGTPVIHGNYAGGAEFVPRRFLVEPVSYRGDGFFGIRRPVFDAKVWAKKAQDAVSRASTGKSLLPTYIDWSNAWPEWEKWMRSGVESQASLSIDFAGASVDQDAIKKQLEHTMRRLILEGRNG